MHEVARIARYCWFTWVMIATGILPDLRPVCLLRGLLVRWCFRSCGKGLHLQSAVRISYLETVTFGCHVYLARGCILGGPEITLDDEVIVGPYVVFAPANHTRQAGSYRFGPPDCRTIIVGRGTWIGAHATITAGAQIGSGAIIGANSVVRKAIPDNVLACGVPAKVVRELE